MGSPEETGTSDVRESAVQKTNGHVTGWSWIERTLKATEDHFVLRYGSAEEEWEGWTVVARVGPPEEGVFKVELKALSFF